MNESAKSLKPYKVPLFVFMLGDILLINICFILAFHFRFGTDVPTRSFAPYWDIMPWLSIATVVIFFGLGLYEKRRNRLVHVMCASVLGVVAVFFTAMALTFWFRGFSFPRSVLLLAMFLQMVTVPLWRAGCWSLERKLHGQRNLLVIGPRADVERLLEKIFELPRGWFKVRKVVESLFPNQLDKELLGVDAVLLVPSVPREIKARVLTFCQGTGREVFLVPDFYDILIGSARMEHLDDLPVVEVQDISLNRLQRVAKRTTDIFVSLFALIVGLPVIVVSAMLIRLTSSGPIFYKQRRVGRRGHVFYLYKFRTMIQDAEQQTGPVLATENDPRITSIGRLLRAIRLDELPQLINVLKGEMSIVGPRPERPVFVEEFDKKYPDYHYRHLVKPGITGLAQIQGKYTTSPEDKLRFDLYYIRNYSLFLDFKIMFQTIPVLLSRESSAGRKEVSQEKREAIYYLVNGYYENSAGQDVDG